MASSFQLQNI